MYKVFIDNRPVIFQPSVDKDALENKNEIWSLIAKFLKSTKPELSIKLKDLDSKQVFEDYQYVEASGGIVVCNDEVLFIERLGKWDLPKGKLEKEERPEEGGIREIEEECGLVQPIIRFSLSPTYHTYEMKGKLFLKKTYWYVLEDVNPTALIAQEEEGITKVEYFKLKDLKKIKQNTYASIIDVIEEFEKIFC